MNRTDSIIAIVAVAFGSIEVVACAVAAPFVWLLRDPLTDVSDRIFSGAGSTLVVAHEQAVRIHKRVAAAKISAADVEGMLLDWTKLEAARPSTLPWSSSQQSKQLASTLQQATDWLELAASSVGLVRKILSPEGSTNAPSETASINQIAEELAFVGERLSEAQALLTAVGQRVDGLTPEKSSDEEIKEAIRLTLRLAKTLSLIDARLAKFEDFCREPTINFKVSNSRQPDGFERRQSAAL